MKQMMEVFECTAVSVVAVEEVPRKISAYGSSTAIARGRAGGVYRVRDLVEKPQRRGGARPIWPSSAATS